MPGSNPRAENVTNRRTWIWMQLQKHGRIKTTADWCMRYAAATGIISPYTFKRDLAAMVEEGIIRREYPGRRPEFFI